MKHEKLDVVRGSGNVFRDLGHKNADVEQFKAMLGAEIIKVLDRKKLSVRAAHSRTGIAAADFSRIRNADLARFSVDRLMSILNQLGAHVEVRVRVRRVEATVPPVCAREPAILRIVGEESRQKGTNRLNMRQIDSVIRGARRKKRTTSRHLES